MARHSSIAQKFFDSTEHLSDYERASSIRHWMHQNAKEAFANVTHIGWEDFSQFQGVAAEILLLPHLNEPTLKVCVKSLLQRKDFRGLRPFLKDSSFSRWPYSVQRDVFLGVCAAGSIDLTKCLIQKITPVCEQNLPSTVAAPVESQEGVVVDAQIIANGHPLLFQPQDWGEGLYLAADGGQEALIKAWKQWEVFKGIPLRDIERARWIADLKHPHIVPYLPQKRGWFL